MLLIFLEDEASGDMVLRLQRGLAAEAVQNLSRVRPGKGLVGQVARSGELAVWEPAEHSDLLQTVLPPGSYALAGVPLVAKGRVLGVMVVARQGARRFTSQEVSLLSAMGQQIGVAIENAWLFDETRRRLAREEWLNDLAHTLGGELNLAALIPRLLPPVAELTGAAAATVAILDPDRQVITYPYNFNLPDILAGVKVPAGSGLAGHTMEVRQPVLVDDYRAHPAAVPAWVEAGVRSMLSVPLLAGEVVVGALGLFSLGEVRPFGPEAVVAAEAAGRLAAVAIQRARLFQAERRRRQEAETLRRAALALATTLDQEQVFELILSQLQQVVPYDSASVQLLRGERLEIIGGRGFPNLPALLGISFPVDGDNPNREVVRRRAPFIVDDVSTVYEEFGRDPHAQAGIRSWLGVPMLVGERLIGMIALDKREPGFYTAEHARLAQAFAAQAAIAIENARLFEEANSRLESLRAVYRIGTEISALDDLSHLLRRVVTTIHEVFRYQYVTIFLVDEKTNEAVWTQGAGFDPADFSDLRLKIGEEGIVGWTAYTGEPYLAPDVSRDARYYERRVEGTRSEFAIPLKSGGRVIGVLDVQSKELNGFGDEDRLILTTLAAQIAVAIENARLFKEVRDTRNYLEKLITSSVDSISTTDEHGIITFYSPGSQRILGIEAEEALGQPLWKYYVRGKEEARKVMAILRRDGELQDYETEFWNEDGRRVPVSLSASLLKDEQGNITGTLGIARDITERQQMQARLMQAEKLAAVGELVAGVAHELNNPLTSVVGYAQLLQRRPLEEGVKRKLGMICREAQRSARIVNNLLAFARQHKPERHYVDVNDVVEKALELLAYQLRTDNVGVVRRLDPALPPTMADPNQLEQVFVNLITNARQAMAEAHGRGTLTVTTQPVGEDRIRVVFADDGPGIPRQIMGKLFDPFFTTKPVGQGTGLGLSICYGLVAEHGGRIWAESEEGQGATFIVELPVEEERVSWAEEALAQLEAPPVRGGRILVVDDEELIIKLLTDVLQEAGHRVVGVTDGAAALRALDTGEYDLIISDLKMPGLSGRELYARLQAERPDVVERLVFTTGDVASPGAQKFLVESGCRYLAKPFDLDVVETVVNDVLAQTDAHFSQ